MWNTNAATDMSEIERSTRGSEPPQLAWTSATPHRKKLLLNICQLHAERRCRTHNHHPSLRCFPVSPQPGHFGDSARVQRAASCRRLPAPFRNIHSTCLLVPGIQDSPPSGSQSRSRGEAGPPPCPGPLGRWPPQPRLWPAGPGSTGCRTPARWNLRRC